MSSASTQGLQSLRAIQAHGAAGVCNDFGRGRVAHARTIRLADGPDEVHREAIAKLELGYGLRGFHGCNATRICQLLRRGGANRG